jgi:predicted Zn-dependent protease
MKTHRLLLASLSTAALLALAGCGTTVVNPVTGEAERTVMDEATEIAEGAKAHKQVIQDEGVYDNPKLQAYVNAVGQKLAAESHRAQLKWTFTVLDSPEINAFALPGGYVYVTRGIMAYLDSEAELAGVIGHEIGHVTARHGAQRATRQQNAGLGVLAATIFGAVLESQGMRGATDIAGQVSQTAAAGYVASYSREQESQADRLGAEYLSRTQYDPRNMIDVIALLKNQEQLAAEAARAEGRPVPSGGNWLASHPSNEQRLAEIRANATLYQGRYADDGRDRYLQAIDGMTFGDSRSQGVVRRRRFFHEPLGLALSAPEGWRIVNDKDAISVINAAGEAGLVIRLLPQEAAGMSHDALIRALLKADQQRVEGRTEARTLHGLQATHFSGVIRNAQGQSAAVRMTVADGPKGHRYLMRYAAQNPQALQRALPGMQEAEASFRELTPADRKAAQPWVIRTVPMPKGGFAELVGQSALAGQDPQAEARLKLMNSAYGEKGSGGVSVPPSAGQRVKTVR